MLQELKRISSHFLTLLKETIRLWSSVNAFQHAGALAFYTLFSMAPMLIIVVTIIGAVYGEEAAMGRISEQLAGVIGDQGAAMVESAVTRSRIDQGGLLPTLLGIAALLFGASTVFAQLQKSLNQFWGVVAKPSRSGLMVFLTSRLVSLGVVIIIGLLLLVSLVISAAVSALIGFADELLPVPPAVIALADITVSLLVATLLFGTIFKILPDVRLRWKDMWHGAFVTACLFVLGKFLISFYLTRTAPASAYGAAGSLVIVLMWVYYSALILFFGAAMTRSRIRARGDRIEPKNTAVKMQLHIEEINEDGSRSYKVPM